MTNKNERLFARMNDFARNEHKNISECEHPGEPVCEADHDSVRKK